jgi:hypothetical protein
MKIIDFVKYLALVICAIVFVCSFIGGLVIQFMPIEGSKDMSMFGTQWYMFTHYWYIWLSTIASAIGASCLMER